MPRFVRLQLLALQVMDCSKHEQPQNSDRLGAYLCADHCEGFALRGVDFARHDAAAWLVFRQAQLSQTAARPTAKEADVVCHLPASPAFGSAGLGLFCVLHPCEGSQAVQHLLYMQLRARCWVSLGLVCWRPS